MQQTDASPDLRPEQAKLRAARGILLWSLLFLICLGLGSPTLNRYDPRTALGTSDSAAYYDLVTAGPAAIEGKMRFRVLVPDTAKPFFRLARGRVKTWNPVFLGLLVANALFTATTAYLLFVVAYRRVGDYAAALLGAMVFLLNFATANIWLSGFIDSGEGCCMMLLTWTLFSDRWWLLPFWGVLGALTKESFVPLSIVFGATWWLVAKRQGLTGNWRAAWVAALAVSGFGTLTILQSVITGHTVWPWQFAAGINQAPSYRGNLATLLLDRNFWYVFIWLLPLGVWRLRRFPTTWVIASGSTVAVGILLSAYVPPAGLVGRVTFDIAGPILSLSVAILFCGAGGLGTTSSTNDRRSNQASTWRNKSRRELSLLKCPPQGFE